ncbi:hypothetical protein P4C99_21535 [Pontiellaceae bacterium B1224]|nr:hypothetical protein [Pontiellaceae bacterium B1224]
MNTKAIAISFIVASSILLSGCQTTKNETVNWEYKVISVHGNGAGNIQQAINRNLIDDWQLDSSLVIPSATSSGDTQTRLIFKKQK